MTDKEQALREQLRLAAEANRILRRELLEAANNNRLTLKVSKKGALSVYGLGRFPVTLYKEQWRGLLAVSAEIERFIAENADSLRAKEKRR